MMLVGRIIFVKPCFAILEQCHCYCRVLNWSTGTFPHSVFVLLQSVQLFPFFTFFYCFLCHSTF